MAAVLRFFQTIIAATRDYVNLVTYVALESIAQINRAWHTINKSNHVDRETRLQCREFEQVVHYDV